MFTYEFDLILDTSDLLTGDDILYLSSVISEALSAIDGESCPLVQGIILRREGQAY